MINAFTHYEFAPQGHGLPGVRTSATTASTSSSRSRTSAASSCSTPTIPTSMPRHAATCWCSCDQLDLAETGPRTLQQGSTAFTTTPNDGLAILNAGRRFVELPFRHNVDDHNVWRVALGMRGDLGDVSDKFLRNLNYDVYYTFARSEDSSRQEGAASRSRYQASLLSSGWRGSRREHLRPEPVGGRRGRVLHQFDQRDQCRAEGHRRDASVATSWSCRPARWVSRWVSNGASHPGGIHSGSVPALRRRGRLQSRTADRRRNFRRRNIFGEVRVPVLGDIPGVENLTSERRLPQFRLRPRWRGPRVYLPVRPRLAVVDSVAFRGAVPARHPRAEHRRPVRRIGAQLPNGINDPCSSRNTTNQTAAVTALCIATGVPASAVYSGRAAVRSADSVAARAAIRTCRRKARTRARSAWCSRRRSCPALP